MTKLQRAAYQRLQRITHDQDSQSGFALIYTLVISMLITTAISSMIIVTASQIQPAQNSVASANATGAAEAGVQAFLALLTTPEANGGCATTQQGQGCPAVDRLAGGALPVKTLVSGQGQYYARATNQATYASTDNFLRVYSRGCSGSFTPHTTVTTTTYTCDVPNVERAIASDLIPPNPFTKNAYYSTYETVGSDLLGQEYPQRTIALPSAPILKAVPVGLSLAALGGNQINWSGANVSAGPPTYNATQKACDSVYYDSDDLDRASNGNGRATLGSVLPGYDWSEGGTTNVGGASLGAGLAFPPHYGQCQVAMTSANNFSGPIQSRDAFFVSGNPTVSQAQDSAGKNLPRVTTSWYGSGQNPAVTAPGYVRDTIRDTIAGTTSDFVPAVVPVGPTGYILPNKVPTNALVDDSSGAPRNVLPNTCVYYGPTRILLSGNTATVTSPMTKAIPGSSCYTSQVGPSLVNAPASPIDPATGKPSGGNGLVLATVDLSPKLVGTTMQSPTIVVRNVGTSSQWAETTGSGTANAGIPTIISSKTNANPIFAVQSGTAPGGAPASTGGMAASLASLWDGSSKLVAGCSSSCKLNTQANFDAANAANNPASPSYASFTATVTGSATQACNNLMAAVTAWNKNLKQPPTAPTGTSDYYYAVSPSSCAANNGAGSSAGGSCASATQPISGYNTDPLLAYQAGTATATCTSSGASSTTYTVTRYSGFCSGSVTFGLCVNSFFIPIPYTWGNALPQFSLTASSGAGQTYANWAVSTWPQSTFPLANDRTIYNTMDSTGSFGPGDAYVAGALTSNLSLVTENDVLVTGSVDPVTPATSTSTAAVLVGGHNVRIYHPVGCKDLTSVNKTSAGFCPNDTTGLFTYNTLPKPLDSNHPSEQYNNLQQDQTKPGTSCADITVNGGIYALGGSPDGASISNGSFTTDNPDKGVSCGNVTLNGGVFQQHRGSIGTTLEDNSGKSTGYTLLYNYDKDLQTKSVPWTPPASTSSKNGSAWSLSSTSSATPGG